MLAGLHREDIKSALRKQFGSLAKFERKEGLPVKSVSDLLRGKGSARVEAAIGKAIGLSEVSDNADAKTDCTEMHSLNAAAR